MSNNFEEWKLNGTRYRVEAKIWNDGTHSWSGFREKAGQMIRIPMGTRSEEDRYPAHVAKRGHELVLRLNHEREVLLGMKSPAPIQSALSF